MKKLIFGLLIVSFTQISFAQSCEKMVKDYHYAKYKRLLPAVHNTFLNNFVYLRSLKAHTLCAPQVAFFKDRGWFSDNDIGLNIVKKSGKSSQEVLDTYNGLLKSGELCEALGEDYKKFKKVRSYLLQKLAE